mmetsp:Transcript_608/g.1761  ORF Transcript_608/g.1761 Transcript_608/m.1761 type:complete len:991 (+) Transcript_608:192-3164(+)
MMQAKTLLKGRPILRTHQKNFGHRLPVTTSLSVACPQQSFQTNFNHEGEHDRYFGFCNRGYSTSTQVLMAKIPSSRMEPRNVSLSMPIVDRLHREEEEAERDGEIADNNDDDIANDEPRNVTVGARSEHHYGARRKGNSRVKVWNDTNRPLQVRVKALMNARRIHPADISAPFKKAGEGSAMENLIASCCMRQNLEGLHLAHMVMDRLLVEKQRVKKLNLKKGNGSEKDFILPIALWDQLLFGWTKLLAKANSKQERRKNQLTSAPAPISPSQIVERMDEIVHNAIQEARVDDQESMSDFQESKVHSSRPTTQFMNVFLYGISLAAQVHEQEEDSGLFVRRAQDFLHEMIHLANKRKGWYTRPNTKSYMHIMQTIAHCDLKADTSSSSSNDGNDGRGQLARSFLDHIHGLSKQLRKRHSEDEEMQAFDGFLEKSDDVDRGDGDLAFATAGPAISIDKQLYTSCLLAISKSVGGTHAVELENVLQLVRQAMKAEVEADKTWLAQLSADPSIDNNSVLSSNTATICDGAFAAMAFKTLANMMQQDEQLRGDEKQRVALGEMAEKLLSEFLVHWEARNQRRAGALSRSVYENNDDPDEAAVSVQSDSADAKAVQHAYNGCLDVWARSYSPEAAPRCEALLFSMMSTFLLNQLLVDPRVDETTKKLIKTELKARDSTGKSSWVRIVVEPDTVSFNTVLYSWSRSHAFYYDRSGRRAVELLNLQEALSEISESGLDNVTPDTQSYTIAILAQSKGPGGESTEIKAPRLRLKTALDLFNKWRATIDLNVADATDTEKNGRPMDSVLEELLVAPFSALLKVIHQLPSTVDRRSAKRSRPKRNQESIMDLDSLEAETVDLYELSSQIYNAVLDDTLKLGPSLYPNHHFYAVFLACVEKHLHPNSVELRNVTEQVWLDACESGEVSRIVWPKIVSMARHIEGGLPRLLGDDVDHFTAEEMSLFTARRHERNPNTRKKRSRARVSQLPRHWWRNVPPAWK